MNWIFCVHLHFIPCFTFITGKCITDVHYSTLYFFRTLTVHYDDTVFLRKIDLSLSLPLKWLSSWDSKLTFGMIMITGRGGGEGGGGPNGRNLATCHINVHHLPIPAFYTIYLLYGSKVWPAKNSIKTDNQLNMSQIFVYFATVYVNWLRWSPCSKV